MTKDEMNEIRQLICWAEDRGKLCDRIRGHKGYHVDIFGPEIENNTWPQTTEVKND